MSPAMYFSASLMCIQNTSGRLPPEAPASSSVQYSTQLMTSTFTFTPEVSDHSSAICCSPARWLLSQMFTVKTSV